MYDKDNANLILKDKRIKGIKRIVIREIVLLADRQEGCTATNKWFVNEFGFGISSITESFILAEELGIIHTTNDGKNRIAYLPKNNMLLKNRRMLLENNSMDALEKQEDALVFQQDAPEKQEGLYIGGIRKNKKRIRTQGDATEKQEHIRIGNETFQPLSNFDFLKKGKSCAKKIGIYDVVIEFDGKQFFQSDRTGTVRNLGLFRILNGGIEAIGMGGKHHFHQSPFSDLETFRRYAALTRAFRDHPDIKLDYYFRQIENWSRKESRMEFDWMNVFERFVTNDEGRPGGVRTHQSATSKNYTPKPTAMTSVRNDFSGPLPEHYK